MTQMMGKILENISIRKIIRSVLALSVIETACYMALKGELEAQTFAFMTGTVIGFYFSKDKSNEVK